MKRRSKYGNVATTVDGIRFASRAEARRYGELKLLVRARKISLLECQPRFKLEVHGVKVCTYVADFCYRDLSTGLLAAEDVKGHETPVFKIKAALFRALHPTIELRVVKA